MKIPFRVLSRSRYEALKCSAKLLKLQIKFMEIFEREDACPEIITAIPPECLPAQGEFSILDVGANVGQWAGWFLRRFPNATVYAVEPDPRAYGGLLELAVRSPNIKPFNIAFHSRSGKGLLFSHKDPRLSSVIGIPGSSNDTSTIEVNFSTVDEFVRIHSPRHVRLIKVDTEGNDLEVLRGAVETLQSEELIFIIVEFGLHPRAGRHVHVNEFTQFLWSYGFYLYRVAGFGLYDGHLYGNALFWRCTS